MTTESAPKGKTLYAEYVKPGLLFEVFEGVGPDAPGVVGYCNGQRSVGAARLDICLRGLQKKHFPPKVVDMAAARARLR